MVEPARMISRPLDAAGQGLFSGLAPQPADPLLGLMAAFRDDPRLSKIDLGVGVYRDADGATPVMRAVKAAERYLLGSQLTKSYVGPEGDLAFLAHLVPLALGDGVDKGRCVAVQTPGGTGALRLAADVIALARPDARVFLGVPSWTNHPPILRAAGLGVVPFQHHDETGAIALTALREAVSASRPGDVVLLHGCCHNPTGVDPSPDAWEAIADLLRYHRLVPLVDLAYHGLGDGLDADVAGLRMLADRMDELLLAYSCDKNFGLYRERTGALLAIGRTRDDAELLRSNLLARARVLWSMPPDHGAAVVRLILESDVLRDDWQAELAEMRERIRRMRALLGEAHPILSALGRQKGMFSTLPLAPELVARLADEQAIHMPASGRVNVAGLREGDISALAAALAAVVGQGARQQEQQGQQAP